MAAGTIELAQQTGNFLELLPIGAMVIDSELRIVDWNRTLVGWTSISKQEAVGKCLTELFPNLSDRRYSERLHQVFSSGFPATYSAALHKHFLPVPARHGLDCELMIQQTEVRRLAESTQLALITIQDVSFQYLQLDQLKRERLDLVRIQTKLAETNQKLLVQNAELDEFARIASHDLQEPLRKITTFGELIQQGLGNQLDEEHERYLYYMTDAAVRMKALISDLLTLSRTGRAAIEFVQLELGDIVNEVLGLLELSIADKRATIEIDQLPSVTGDRRLISQLLQNLIGNALKFSDKRSPQVTITAQSNEGQWVFGVKDNGIGIDNNQLDRVFEPFVRLHSREAYEGTGFGLSICKKAVDRHGGRIWVESKLGEGAHFKFTLPTVTAQVEPMDESI